MKIYTKKGDQGFTSFLCKNKISKAEALLNFYGDLDELNAFLGFAAELFYEVFTNPEGNTNWQFLPDVTELAIIYRQIKRVQKELLEISGEFATYLAGKLSASITKLDSLNTKLALSIKVLEEEIDEREPLAALRHKFIAFGGGELAVRLQLARAVCRRAERSAASVLQTKQHALKRLTRQKVITPNFIAYLNRLSDWLYVTAVLVTDKSRTTNE